MYLDHPNLIKLYSYFSDEYNIYLLMELGCDGQLYDLMKIK
jgi:serine/threonine protein kinase